MNLHKQVWTEALQMDDFREEGTRNEEKLKRLVGLAEGYEKRVKEETELTKDQLKTRYVGKLDPKKRMIPCDRMDLYRVADERANRSGGCWAATHRRQYCFCLKTDD